jgi:hypothetical protein
MSQVNVDALASEVAAKFIEILTGAGREIASYATAEARKLATSAVEIAALRATGVIDDEELRLHLVIQKNASQAVLSAVQGIGIIAAEQAINAGLKIIAGAIKTATGITLPGA